MKKQKQDHRQYYEKLLKQDQAQREAYRAYVREKFIEEYNKAQDRT